MEGEERLIKRRKVAAGRSQIPGAASGPRIFAPFRTVGLVSPTDVPFTSVPLGKTTFQITTSVGRSLQTYDLRRGLNLVFITRPQTPELITASVAWKDKVLAAWGGEEPNSRRGVWVMKRGKKEGGLEIPAGLSENVQTFCVLGAWIIGVCHSELLVWKDSSYELYTRLQGTSPVPFTSCISRLPTYLNKIIVGREDGSAEIWNVSSGKLIYTILPPSTSVGPISAIEPTTALSMVAIAYQNGPLVIHDIRTDQMIMQLRTPAGAPITSISFRTDGMGAGDDGRSAGVMATASSMTGDITMWDLNNGGRKTGVLRAAHAPPTSTSQGGVTKIEFLPSQAILVSTGADNSLRTWIFDEAPFSPIPRPLHERRGHAAPISRLMFLPTASDGSDDTGKWLMAGSRDRSLWGWSLRRDGQSTELSQGAVKKKAKKQGLMAGEASFSDLKCPPISAIACSLNRDGGIGALPGKQPIWQSGHKGKKVDAEISAMTGWESVLTAHEGDSKARTWFWGRKRAGRWAFETGDGGQVSSVAMSPCGTFGLVGSDKGGIDMFNLQSGLHRLRFPARLTLMQAKQLRLDLAKHGLTEESDGKKKFYRGQGKHTASVVGVAVDSLNKTVVSAGADGKIKFWNFSSGLLQDQLDWSGQTEIISLRLHRAAELIALSCSDGYIRVVDITTRKLIRELCLVRKPKPKQQIPPISDFVFSSDGRWISACAGDLVVLWDLPTGHLIEAFKLHAECTALAFSPTGEFLATATIDNVGVDVWSNRSLFTHVATRHISDDELSAIMQSKDAKAPTASGEGSENLLLPSNVEGVTQDLSSSSTHKTAHDLELLSSSLLSLSFVPKSRWQNLLYLDLIRQRNKPIEPPKKPEKAPFFLPSLQDAANKLALPAPASTTLDDAELQREQTRVLQLARQGAQSSFTQLLQAAEATGDYAAFIEHLKTLGPAAADVEIRSLGSSSLSTSGVGGADDEHAGFVRALTWLLRAKRDFELVQAWMAVFLRVHGDVVLADDELRDAVADWREALEGERKRVQKLASYCGGVAGYVRAARV